MQESPSEVVIYFEEKNAIPEQYSGRETRNKRFYDLVVVQDFPLCSKKLWISAVVTGFWSRVISTSTVTGWRYPYGTVFILRLFYKRVILIIIRLVVSYWGFRMALTVFFRSSNTAIIEWLSSLGSVYPCTGLAAFWKEYRFIDKVALSRGELYTILTNKASHGGKGNFFFPFCAFVWCFLSYFFYRFSSMASFFVIDS